MFMSIKLLAPVACLFMISHFIAQTAYAVFLYNDFIYKNSKIYPSVQIKLKSACFFFLLQSMLLERKEIAKPS